MTKTLTFLGLLFIIFTVEANALTSSVQISGNPLYLTAEDKSGVLFTATEVVVNSKSYSPLTNPIFWARGDRTLTIQWGSKIFNFHVPAANLNANGELSVHQSSTNQSAHIRSKIARISESKSIKNKLVACPPAPVFKLNQAQLDERFSENFKMPQVIEAQVEESKWQEQTTYFIFDSERNLTVLRESPSQKTSEKILSGIAACFSEKY